MPRASCKLKFNSIEFRIDAKLQVRSGSILLDPKQVKENSIY